MAKIMQKIQNKLLRRHRIRATISGTSERPRLSVHVSNTHVTAQVIDDTAHRTLAYASTVGRDTKRQTLTEKATWVGTEIAKKAKSIKVKQVVFDRNGKLYHGRVKALADAARTGGLEF